MISTFEQYVVYVNVVPDFLQLITIYKQAQFKLLAFF